MSSDNDWRALYPFESNWCDLDGRRMHYLDEGQGAPLLMVHGNPTWSFYWRNVIGGLHDAYRAIAVDHIGCGLSEKPQRYPYCLAQHTENLVAFIERLDLRNITLLAHDWGGAIGLGAAVARRERFSRIVLFNTGAFPPPFFPWRIRVCRTPVLGKLAVQGLNVFARAAISMAVENRERMTPQVAAGLLAPYDSWAHRTAIYEFVRDIPASRRHPTYQVLVDLEENLKQLADLPALFVWGMRDWCFRPICLDRLCEHFPTATAVRLANAGHYVVEDEPERVMREVRTFLEQHPVDVARGVPAGDANRD